MRHGRPHHGFEPALPAGGHGLAEGVDQIGHQVGIRAALIDGASAITLDVDVPGPEVARAFGEVVLQTA